MEDVIIAPQAPFSNESWSEKVPEVNVAEPPKLNEPPAAQEPPKTDTPPAAATPETQATQFDEDAYIKKEWGFDSKEVAKNEIQSLREKAKGFEFANEDSKRVFEYIKDGKEDDLYGFLKTKKTIEKLITADVSDKNIAAELVKFGIQSENKDLTAEDVDYLFNEKFATPDKPIQKDEELDEDYLTRVSQWENSVKNIERGLSIEAKLAKPKLEKLKTELVLPEIPKEANQAPKQTQEELQKFQALRDSYLLALEEGYKSFDGYEVKYKDEEVEVPINFVVTDEEKVALKEEMKTFDVDDFIEKRWFNEGKPNVKQMMDDITLLRKKEIVFQKIANETGAQILKHYRAIKGNVVVNGEKTIGVLDNSQKSDMGKQIEFLWNQK